MIYTQPGLRFFFGIGLVQICKFSWFSCRIFMFFIVIIWPAVQVGSMWLWSGVPVPSADAYMLYKVAL